MATKLPAHKAPRSYDEIIDEVVHDRDALEVVFVAERRQSCMGAGGALGHPKVFYTVGDKGYVECMYCDRVFILDPDRAGQNEANMTPGGDPKEQAKIGDGITESATPPPGENRVSGRDSDA